jgi:uncharacterized protein YecT (DUF1311 family)
MNGPTKCAATYLALLFACSGHAAAFALPSFAPNCADPFTQSEIIMCACAEREAADKAMTSIYDQVIGQLREQDRSYADLGPDYVGAEMLMEASQQTWSTSRADFCSAAGLANYGGSMRPAVVATCFAMLARSRTEAFRWLLE